MPDGNAGDATVSSDNNATAQADNLASRLPPLSQAPRLALKSNDLRELVLDYLSHSCYVNSAIAFAKEWDQLEGPSKASLSASLPGASASSAATSTYEGLLNSSSADQANHAPDEDASEETDDQMMESIHGSFSTTPHASNGYNTTFENGKAGTAYHDRHHHHSASYKHLTSEQIEQLRARKGVSSAFSFVCTETPLTCVVLLRNQATNTTGVHTSGR